MNTNRTVIDLEETIENADYYASFAKNQFTVFLETYIQSPHARETLMAELKYRPQQIVLFAESIFHFICEAHEHLDI